MEVSERNMVSEISTKFPLIFSDTVIESVTNGALTVNICHLTQFAVFDVKNGGNSVQSEKKSGMSKTTTIIIAAAVPGGVVLVAIVVAIIVIVKKRQSGGGPSFVVELYSKR